jgi:hypothetical protein
MIRKLMLDADLSYEHACRAYLCLVSILEDGVVNGEKIGLGRIGCLVPVRRQPRDVVMGFERKPDGSVNHIKRVFHIDERTEYKFRLYGKFVQKHHLKG